MCLHFSNGYTYIVILSFIGFTYFFCKKQFLKFPTVNNDFLNLASFLRFHIHMAVLIVFIPPMWLYQNFHEMTVQDFC